VRRFSPPDHYRIADELTTEIAIMVSADERADPAQQVDPRGAQANPWAMLRHRAWSFDRDQCFFRTYG
jgi:hypothetical protein